MRMSQIVNRNLEILQKLNIIDDFMFFKMCEDKEVCEEIISTILGRKIQVAENHVQYAIRNCGARSVTLDCLCIDVDGNYINVEVQKADNDDHVKRMRVNAANIDTTFTEKGGKFKDFPDVYVIYIAKFDILGFSDIINHIRLVSEEHPGQFIDDGIHRIVVNASVHDDSELGKLMTDYRADASMFPAVGRKLRDFKDLKGGNEYMCKELDDYILESYLERSKATVLKQIKNSLISTAEQIEEYFNVSAAIAESWLQEGKQLVK